MKKNYLAVTAAFLFMTSISFAQRVFIHDDFDFYSAVNHTTTGAYFNSPSSYFTVTTEADTGIDIDEGDTRFFGAQQLTGASNILSYNGIDIAGQSEIIMVFSAAEDDAADGNEDWDTNDKVTFRYRIDGGAWTPVFAFAGSGTDTAPRVDTNFDGIGNGQELTSQMEDFDALIVNSGGTSLDFQIVFEGLTEVDEDFAFGYFALAAEVDKLPAPSIVSPNDNTTFPNGTSSVTITYDIDNTAHAVEIWANGTKVGNGTTLTGTGTFDLPVSDNTAYDYSVYVLVDSYIVETTSRYLEVGVPLSTEENQIEGITVYPNPVLNNNFYINTASAAVKEVKLYNTLGELVINTSVINKQSIDVSGLTSGIYILRVFENNKTSTHKLVVN